MVILHVKKGEQGLFLYETNTGIAIGDLLKSLIQIYNGKLKIDLLCNEINELSKHGASLPPNMQGLTSEQIEELNLKDDWTQGNLTLSDYQICLDPLGKRNGFAPLKKYADILTKAVAEAKTRNSKKLTDSGICMTEDYVTETLDILKGAITICYPMGLPPYETIHLVLNKKEQFSCNQVGNEILDEINTDIWWANKLLDKTKTLSGYIGKNEKSKLIVKLQKKGLGAPCREPVLSELQRKDLMLAQYERREELKKLNEDDEISHLNSQWADNKQLKKSFLGLNKIRFK